MSLSLKNLLLFGLLMFSASLFAQPRFRMASNGAASWTSLGGGKYQATVNFLSDQTGQSFLPTAIDTSFYMVTGTEQRYKVDSVLSKSFTQAVIRVLQQAPTASSPIGQVVVYDPDGFSTIGQGVFGSLGVTAQINAAIDEYNARQATGGSGGADTIYLADGTAIVNGDTLPDFVTSTSGGLSTYITTDSFSTFRPLGPIPDSALVWSTTRGAWFQKFGSSYTRRSWENGTLASTIYTVSNDTLTFNSNLNNRAVLSFPTSGTAAYIAAPDYISSQAVGEIFQIGIQNNNDTSITVSWADIYGKFDGTAMPDVLLTPGSVKNYQFQVVADGFEGVILASLNDMGGGTGSADTIYLADGTPVVNGDTLPDFIIGIASDTIQITQASPTFVVGDLVNFRTGTTSGSIQLADLDVDSLMCKGIITAKVGNLYTIQTGGLVIYPGVIAGVEYYLSGTAGDTTSTVLDSFQYIGIGARDGVLLFNPGLKVVNSLAIADGSGDAIFRDTITQTAHGFSIPTKGYIPARRNSNGLYEAATTFADSTLHRTFIVDSLDANTFVLQESGLLHVTGHGLTIGADYFLRDNGSESITPDTNFNDWTVYVYDANTIALKAARPLATTTAGSVVDEVLMLNVTGVDTVLNLNLALNRIFKINMASSGTYLRLNLNYPINGMEYKIHWIGNASSRPVVLPENFYCIQDTAQERIDTFMSKFGLVDFYYDTAFYNTYSLPACGFWETPIGTIYDTSYQAILDRATALGYSLPSSGQRDLQNQLVLDLKSAGIWDSLDIFYVMANDGGGNFATINWKNPLTNQITTTNAPAFVTNQGFRGDTIIQYINYPFDFTTGTTNYKQNDCSWGIWKYNNTKRSAGYDFESIDNGQVRNWLIGKYIPDSDKTYHRVQNAGAPIITSPATADGWWCGSRATSSNMKLYKDGSLFHNGAGYTSSTFSGTGITINRSQGGSTQPIFSICYMGSNLQAKMSAFYTALNTYMTSL